MSGTNPQALLSPWHRPEPLGFSVMATTIFCQHWALSSPICPKPHAKIRAQTIPPLLLNKEFNPAPKQIKGDWVAFWAAWEMAKERKTFFFFWAGCQNVALLSGRLISTDLFQAATLARCFPEMKSWRRGEGWGGGGLEDKLHHGILMGRWGSQRNPRRDSHIKKTWACLPQGHSTLKRQKQKTARQKPSSSPPLESAKCVGVVVHGFSVTLPVFRFNRKHYISHIVQIKLLFH